MPIDAHRAANLAAWDERVPVHAASRMYDDGRWVLPEGQERLPFIYSLSAVAPS
jgi:hypothetical protein